MKYKLPLWLLASVVFLAACGGESERKSPKEERGKLKVLSSFSILTDMAEAVGKDLVEVYNLVPIGMAPHSYEPKPSDVKFAADADLILYNGLNLEGGDAGWLMKLAHSVRMEDSRIIKAAAKTEPLYLTDERGATEVNPHAFISPVVGISMAETIVEAFAAADPENEAFYRENAAAYIARLKEVDAEYRQKINSIPPERRVFMASEQAFQYLVKEYGLKEGFIWAIDTDKNGTPEQIKKAIAFVNDNKPPVLFVESNVDRRPMETVSKATGVEIYEHAVFSDELGKPGQKGDTYIKYLQYNLEQIYNGLRQGS